MGVRITAFTFSASRLQRVLDLPLWQLLGRLSRLPRDQDARLFSAYDPERRERYYGSATGGVIRSTPGRPMQELDQAALSQVPLLHQSGARYLAGDQGDSYDLAFLLHALAAEPASNVAHLITDGHRRWWIGSLLTSAHDSQRLDPADFDHLRACCARILRAYDCGFPLPGADGPSLRTLPYLPTQDGDYFMNLFDSADADRFVDLLQRLQDTDIHFTDPASSFPASSPADWDAYVRDRIAEFLTRRSLSSPHDHLITFIG